MAATERMLRPAVVRTKFIGSVVIGALARLLEHGRVNDKKGRGTSSPFLRKAEPV